MKKITFLLLIVTTMLTSAANLYAQCTVPDSIGTPTVTPESCPGNGSIIVGSVSPALASGEHYQYRLMDTSGNEEKPWQDSVTFTDVAAGVYNIEVRTICSTGISSSISRQVTVGSSYSPAYISSVSVTRTAKCCDGTITVSATGTGPLEYALVTSLSAPDVPDSILKPKQSSNVLDSLCAGTHYVRVYDACGGFMTSAVNVGVYTSTPGIASYNYKRFACDSLTLDLALNGFRYRTNTKDTAIMRTWIV